MKRLTTILLAVILITTGAVQSVFSQDTIHVSTSLGMLQLELKVGMELVKNPSIKWEKVDNGKKAVFYDVTNTYQNIIITLFDQNSAVSNLDKQKHQVESNITITDEKGISVLPQGDVEEEKDISPVLYLMKYASGFFYSTIEQKHVIKTGTVPKIIVIDGNLY